MFNLMTEPLAMSDDLVETENRAWLGRVTCGWKKPNLSLEDVLRYWRDVHSPSIARRPGIWEYRHFQFDPVRPDLAGSVHGVELECPADEQLMWTSDVRYAGQTDLDAFSGEPNPAIRGHMLADIELIVDQSTTYRVVKERGRTYVDRSGDPAPQGKPTLPTFALFFRQAGTESEFQAFLSAVSVQLAADPAVVRLRLAQFEAPDMEAERKSGYPIKTHPLERQYQAWIDITLKCETDLARLLEQSELNTQVKVMHIYPVRAIYTSNRAGKPTFVGLRGYGAFAALKALGGTNQAEPSLLEWMYGPVAIGVPAP